ncbi:fasciclin domain-containing protein [Chitinophaga solisilvae]|uniref:FAS1 domain-containing protein n=1 Tax=Chitinophaga solisilvae TaxID=1233460 RepID=A0A9Q5D7P4_9BACT|nr:fasciclin domain-containing protein [Chitinophaga solisilvae]NSL87880.1 hypothetical protein [Chitinophaga solisilvae]
MKILLQTAAWLLLVSLLSSSCKKDYYIDGGLAEARYHGSIYSYLKNNPYLFDTIAHVVEKAGLRKMLESDTVTFFSPTDNVIGEAMNVLNEYRYINVEDSVHMDDISPEIWRRFLSRYIIRGRYEARQFARVDPKNIYAYPGINYVMESGYVLNIGLIYQDYNNVEAVGARILRLTDITFDPLNFTNNPSIIVATSDIQPDNGVLHVLNMRHTLGFRLEEFVRVAEQYLQNR